MRSFKSNIPTGLNRLLYILLCVVALLIYSMQRFNIEIPSLIDNYINDFICLPLVLGGILFLIRSLKKDDSFRFPFVFIVFMASYYSLYFEYYLPLHNPRYTADWIDVLLYFSGALTFFFLQKKAPAKSAEAFKHKRDYQK